MLGPVLGAKNIKLGNSGPVLWDLCPVCHMEQSSAEQGRHRTEVRHVVSRGRVQLKDQDRVEGH